MADKPIIYILHGDDEFAVAQFLSAMEEKMGDRGIAEMNITRLDGRSFVVENIATVAHAMPFLAERRLVVLHDPLGNMKSPAVREKLKSSLENIPTTTAFVIVIPRPLVSERDKRNGTIHWLQKWAAKNPGRTFVREFTLPRGPQMARWIQSKAKESGGEFSFEAAGTLASFTQDDPRLAAQEIEKLLAYVNYNRAVEPDDVERLTSYAAEGNVFEMVDALGNRKGEIALRMLQRLLEEDEPLRLFGMIVRQFRMLLLTRELLDSGHREAEIAKQMKTYPFIAKKLIGQVQNFSLENLETIYRKLVDVDESIKTGKIDGDIALVTLVTALTT